MTRALMVLIVFALGLQAWAYAPESKVTRGIYVHYRDLVPLKPWGNWGTGYELVQEAPHSGQWCLKAVGTEGTEGQGASQTVPINQERPAPLKIAGWSRAEGVQATGTSYRYSLYVDLIYADGESWPAKVAPFRPGSHDWEYSEIVIEPAKPVASARFYVFIRGLAGTVWFDDLFFGPPDGANLLQEPGFERVAQPDTSRRDRILDTYQALHANAIHTYLALPERPEAEADLRTVLATARERGMGVVVTTHISTPPISDTTDPNFPQYLCVLGPWGDRWVQTLAGLARYDLMGVSLVPDEFNWTNGALRRAFERHQDEGVRKFYADLPNYCNCPVCQERFQQWYGEPLPELGPWSRPPAQTDAYRKFVDFRYRATAEWIARGAAAVKAVNPQVRADSLICVSPICFDFRLGTGVAWDMMGYGSQIDFPTTDPYIILHNYLGDSTHWYVTETTAHLVGCTPRRQAGVVLEAARLREEYRALDPVEIYGSALSAVSRGARELAWWHYVHIMGEKASTQPNSFACAGGAYDLLERVDPWLDGARPERRVALLYSRASEEWFSFYTHPEPHPILTHATADPRYPFLAQKEVLYWLFRAAVPTDLYYLDQVSAAELRDYPVIVVPFPFAAGPQQVALLGELARSGKQVLIISEFGTVDELGAPLPVPALLQLCGLAAAPQGEKQGTLSFSGGPACLRGRSFPGLKVYETVIPAEGTAVWGSVEGTPAVLAHEVGAGRVIFLAGEFGIGLPANRDNEYRGRDRRVWPAELSSSQTAVLRALLDEMYGGPVSLLLRAPVGKDLEVAAMRNADGAVLLFAINWEFDPVSCQVALPPGAGSAGEGLALDSAGQVSPVTVAARAGVVELSLAGQQALVLHLR